MLPVAAGDHVALRLTASFQPQSFESGEYLVHVGLRQASIRLEHEGYDVDDKYSATVAKEFWHEKNKEKIESQMGAQGEATGKGRLAGVVAFAGKFLSAIKRQDVRTFEGRTVLPLVEATPEGWTIGGAYGDPRAASEAGHADLAGCLRGDYLTGREGEARDAAQRRTLRPPCCARASKASMRACSRRRSMARRADWPSASSARTAPPPPRPHRGRKARRNLQARPDRHLPSKASREARGAALPGEILLCEETRGVPSPRARRNRNELAMKPTFPRKADRPWTPMEQALRRIDDIVSSDRTSFRDLVDVSGLDPRLDFRNVRFNGVPLTDQDIRGFDFSGADLTDTDVQNARYDGATRFDGALFSGPSLDPDVIDFNRRLRDLRFGDAERAVRDRLAANRVVDVVGFSTLIKKAPDEMRRAHWLDEMRRLGVTPDVVTFSTLIEKAPDETRRAHWLDEMRRLGVAPNVVTFSTLIEKAPDEARRAHWLDEMRRLGVAPNVVTFNTLIEKAPDEARRAHWLDEMRRLGVAPNVVTFSTLIEKAPDEAGRAHWLDEMRRLGVAPNDFVFNILIEKAPDEAGRAHWLDEMRRLGLAPDVVTFTTLIKAAADAARALLARPNARGRRRAERGDARNLAPQGRQPRRAAAAHRLTNVKYPLGRPSRRAFSS
ncbi:MAG: hypothetical protein HZY79_01765 [Rhodoblastus sp.]|nr:MAG: hypothetical protein HZY79_01765 [Rhodoblastus sp.]